MAPRPSGIVALLSDFGLDDPYIGVMKGVLLRASNKVTIVDLGHGVPRHDVAAGAFWLAAAIGRFPAGTVHVAVVDPGVGTERRLLAASAADGYWLAPDNGLLAPVLSHDAAAEVRAIDAVHLGLRPESRTFHGRDVLAPVAGWLAGGRYGFSALGPRIADPVVADGPFAGAPRIVHVDGFGNLVSNVPGESLRGARAVRIGGREVPLCGTYAETASGELLALIGSYGMLEVAVNRGSAAKVLGLSAGAPIELLRA